MKILITGINGLIGEAIANFFLSQGYDVSGIGRTTHNSLSKKIRFYQLDLSEDYKNFSKVIDDYFDLVIHCAAQQPSEGVSIQAFYNSNILATSNLLSWMKICGMKKIIHFSTLALLKFSNNPSITHCESSPPQPSNSYTLSKASAEKIILAFSNSEEFVSYCLRIPSLVHPKQKGGVIHSYFVNAYKQKPIDLYDMGMMRRNLINIQSIIQALDAIINSKEIPGFNLFNLGSRDSWNQMKIAEYFYKKLYSIEQIFPVNKPSSILGHWNINLSKSESELGYKPWMTEEILDDFLKVMLDQAKIEI